MVEVWQSLEIQQGLVNKESRGGGGESQEGGGLHLESTPDLEPSSHNVIPALPKVDGYNAVPCLPKIPQGTHPSAKKSPPSPAPRRVGVAAREGTSGLWAGGVGASLAGRTVSSRGGSPEEQGNQVTAERGGETGGGGEPPP